MNVFGRLLLLFTIVPIIELALLIQIGTWIGTIPTVLIVLVTGGVGAFLARQQGGRVWLRIQEELQAGGFPADHLIDGLLLVVAGALLLTPGLLTDILGMSVLIPFTRAPIREFIKRRLRLMADNGTVQVSGFFRRY
jgi:UPF0716 protein FxsA